MFRPPDIEDSCPSGVGLLWDRYRPSVDVSGTVRAAGPVTPLAALCLSSIVVRSLLCYKSRFARYLIDDRGISALRSLPSSQPV